MILLVRHGETPFNAARVVQPPETPLSERGIEQARRVALRVAQLGAALIVSSDLVRARTTAEIIAHESGAPLELDALLQERNFGDLRGRAYVELDADIFAPSYLPPGGESGAQLDARAALAFAMVLRKLEGLRGNLVIVSHGLLCASLVRGHVTLAGGVEAPAHFTNASLTTIERIAPFRVVLLNDAAHLADLNVAGGAV